jgi:hypothetical protein
LYTDLRLIAPPIRQDVEFEDDTLVDNTDRNGLLGDMALTTFRGARER